MQNAALSRSPHASHLIRCITGLPGTKADLDTSRVGVAYYCLSGLDLLNSLEGNKKIFWQDLIDWKDWLWQQFIEREAGSGFRTGTSKLQMLPELRHIQPIKDSSRDYDQPHLIMTYTALLSLSILRDDFSRLDHAGILKFLKSTQHLDGSFSSLPIGTISSESDLRLTFCAFAICSMLDDWSHIDVDNAIRFIQQCRTYEGGYGEVPNREAQGGPTYCALASLALAAKHLHPKDGMEEMPELDEFLSPHDKKETTRWLVQKQKGGFQGRTEKSPDACYCFWCGASLKILNEEGLVDKDANTGFLSACQYKHGGIAKAPGEIPDPYHTYLSLASLALYPPTEEWLADCPDEGVSWKLEQLDPLLNLRVETARWARTHIPSHHK
ncbi:hypothetical protein M422DRAFT_152995 [Sphaerobolus stellatus SS14]|nr:hypothetical protein M422DRAFT_152995 [Sphaerobolus stellatus SS14]